jgi:hypothetical protein
MRLRKRDVAGCRSPGRSAARHEKGHVEAEKV